jgi:hypothetical protein
MTLLPPEVVGPLSVCSKSAWIRGNISGATIHVVVADHVTTSYVTTACDGVYSVGVTLKADEEVSVRPADGGQGDRATLHVLN